MEEKLHFKVSSGLKDIIGRDLITNELVAIFELVKNGYDADATEINLVINSYEDYILIQDNGVGINGYLWHIRIKKQVKEFMQVLKG